MPSISCLNHRRSDRPSLAPAKVVVVYLVNITQQLRDEVQYETQSILFGDRSLRNAAQEFISHYHAERNHQGLDDRLIEPGDEAGCAAGKIACRERLGGMLRYYYRRAA